MDSFCALASWGIIRSVLLITDNLPELYTQSILINYFAGVNAVTFSAIVLDKLLSPNFAKVPEKYLYGLTLAGGSPAATLSMIFLHYKSENNLYKWKHLYICSAQCFLLMTVLEIWYPKYSYYLQLQHTFEEISIAKRSFCNALFEKFQHNIGCIPLGSQFPMMYSNWFMNIQNTFRNLKVFEIKS